MATKSLNKVMLIGNLGKDADLRYTSTGMAVANFSLATNERIKSGESDEWQEKTEWHNIVLWGKLAESVSEYLLKGQKVYVEGRLQTRSWEDKDGIKRYTTDVVARDLILLGGRGDSSYQSQRPPHPADTYAASTAASAPAPTHTGMVSDNHYPAPPDVVEEEVPF